MERLYPRFIILHHTAGHDVSALEIDRYHAGRGFGVIVAEPPSLVEDYVERGFERVEGGVVVRIGYHYLIRADGSVEKGRPDFVQGAHCSAQGMNFKSIGIALTGNFDSIDNPYGQKGHTKPTGAQIAALKKLLFYLMDIYQIPQSRIIKHRDVAGAATSCPGDRFSL
ncbi:MAG TPA: N-acetylmuramoyl-L-alanine amidase [Thermoanaerobacterales bacterium]|nr:N-acetylmuramoyl-L-alanine amidase [Thermoanaerobacterales bacterium]